MSYYYAISLLIGVATLFFVVLKFWLDHWRPTDITFEKLQSQNSISGPYGLGGTKYMIRDTTFRISLRLQNKGKTGLLTSIQLTKISYSPGGEAEVFRFKPEGLQGIAPPIINYWIPLPYVVKKGEILHIEYCGSVEPAVDEPVEFARRLSKVDFIYLTLQYKTTSKRKPVREIKDLCLSLDKLKKYLANFWAGCQVEGQDLVKILYPNKG